jgi:hypothetical protein
MLKYMPDTNIVIYKMKKKPASVRAAFKKHDGRMGNSSITSITEPSLLRPRERSVAPVPRLMISGDCGRLLPLPVVDCRVRLRLPRSDKFSIMYVIASIAWRSILVGVGCQSSISKFGSRIGQ